MKNALAVVLLLVASPAVAAPWEGMWRLDGAADCNVTLTADSVAIDGQISRVRVTPNKVGGWNLDAKKRFFEIEQDEQGFWFSYNGDVRLLKPCKPK